MTIVWFLFLLLALVGWVVYLFNTLITLSNSADAAWADIDVHLKRRYDLIPKLLELVKTYAAHEQDTFAKVAAARTAALDAYTPAEKSRTEPAVNTGTRALLALAESYPQLKANEEFVSLSITLTNIEEHLLQARRSYNSLVRDLHTKSHVFPNNLLASLFGLESHEYFDGDDAPDSKPAGA